MRTKEIYRKGVPSNELFLKQELLRIVKTKDGLVKVDVDQNIKGRGVYLIKDINNIPLIKKRRLIERGLRINSSIDYIFEEIINVLKQ